MFEHVYHIFAPQVHCVVGICSYLGFNFIFSEEVQKDCILPLNTLEDTLKFIFYLLRIVCELPSRWQVLTIGHDLHIAIVCNCHGPEVLL